MKIFKTKKHHFIFEKKIALLGNPNVGKSTLFNLLTGLKQHTGNWAGKTVSNAVGTFNYKNHKYNIIDLPGTYSLNAFSEEEFVTKNYIENEDIDIIIIVVDSTSLERNLKLVLECLSIKKNIIVCLNLLDDAKKKGIKIDINKLEKELNVPVVGISAKKKIGIDTLLEKINSFNIYKALNEKEFDFTDIDRLVVNIYNNCIINFDDEHLKKMIKIDKILTSKKYGFPIMLLGFGIILWITIIGSNYPSILLTNLLFGIYDKLFILFNNLSINPTFTDFLLNGIYKVVAWVVAVMLPPMAIFFPLFSLLEEFGFLPRIAFNLDYIFKKFGAHGKQSLTMCMGYGCNACGVTGCRIIESKKEKLIAILTNVFSPCNGRFPSLIAIISIFLISSFSNKFISSVFSALILLVVIILSIFVTLVVSKILSKTILKGEVSSFSLELPPFRKPNIFSTIFKSFYEKAIFVLGRAIYITVPAGALIWFFTNINIFDHNILYYLISFFDPIGHFIGLDGTIIVSFILGFPANEIVIPIMLMAYSQQSALVNYSSFSHLSTLLTNNGWTIITAISFIVFTICHFPCGTTLLTIKKETGSYKWMFLSIFIPLITGIILCIIVSSFLKIFLLLV